MFARKVRVSHKGQPCPLKWLDNFSMRSFTNDAVFDDTLPTADGVLEIGARVPLDTLKGSMEDWFRKKGYIGQNDVLDVVVAKTEAK
jgi:hypothetical protein